MYFQLTDAADSLHVILHWHCPNKRGFMLSCITYQLHDAVKETQIIFLFLLDIVKLLSCKKAHSNPNHKHRNSKPRPFDIQDFMIGFGIPNKVVTMTSP